MTANVRSSMSAEQIRERAYHIWEIEGRPHGRDMEHWFRAEAECTPKSRARPAAKRPRKKAASA